MWTIIKTFLMTNWLRVVEILGALGAVLAIYNSGRNSERVDELKRVVKDTGKAHDIENKNSALSDAAVDEQLRNKWSR